jgi:hypothetical protein
VLWGILVYHDHFWSTIVVDWTRNLVIAASLPCNSKCCLVILKTLVNVLPWLNISSCSNVRKALFMLVVINQVLCSTIFVSIKDSIDSSVLNLFFSVLLKTLCFKLKMLLFSMHCIAHAFGKHGYTNVHSHENSVPLLVPYHASLDGDVVIP